MVSRLILDWYVYKIHGIHLAFESGIELIQSWYYFKSLGSLQYVLVQGRYASRHTSPVVSLLPLLTPGTCAYSISIYIYYFRCLSVRSSFSSILPVIRPVIHPSKFLIPEQEDDGRGGGGGMAAAAVYPNVYVIQSCSL